MWAAKRKTNLITSIQIPCRNVTLFSWYANELLKNSMFLFFESGILQIKFASITIMFDEVLRIRKKWGYFEISSRLIMNTSSCHKSWSVSSDWTLYWFHQHHLLLHSSSCNIDYDEIQDEILRAIIFDPDNNVITIIPLF